MPRIVHLKITYYPSEEIRRHKVDLDAPPTLEQLKNTLQPQVLTASLHSHIFKYCDDEGDYVTIGSEEEWHDALLYNQQRPMRIQIIHPHYKDKAPKHQEAAPNQPAGLGEGVSELIHQFIGGCPHFPQQWQQQNPTQAASEESASSSARPPPNTDGSQQNRGDFNPAGFEECFRQIPQFQAMARQFLQGLQASGCCSASYPSSSSAASSSGANPTTSAASADNESGSHQQQQQQQQQDDRAAPTGFDEFVRQNPQFQPYVQMAMQFLQGLPASASSSANHPQPNLEQLMRGLFHRTEPAQTREQQLATLHELGYLDDDANTVLLDRFHGNVERVVQEYVQFTSGQ